MTLRARVITTLCFAAAAALALPVSGQPQSAIPPVLVGWQWAATGPIEYIAETAATSNVAHVGGATDDIIRERVRKAAQFGLRSTIGVQRYLFNFQQLKQKDDRGRPRSALHPDYQDRLRRLWSLLGDSSLHDSVIVFALADEPYAHLRDLGMVRWEDSPEARQLHADINEAIAFIKQLAPGRLTLIAFASGELLVPAAILRDLVLPPALDLIGIDCYMNCPAANLPRIYSAVIQVKRAHQKLAPTFSAGRRDRMMTASIDKEGHADVLDNVWKKVIAEYPGETRYYLVNAYQTAIRDRGNFRQNTYGAVSMPNTYRAYSIFMTELLGRSPDLSPRCALSIFPRSIPTYLSEKASSAARSAELHWIATDASSITLSDQRRSLGSLSPVSGGSTIVSPGPGVTTYTATVVKGNVTSTCNADLKVTESPPPKPFSNLSPKSRSGTKAGSVTLRWQRSEGADNYVVYIGNRRVPTDTPPHATTRENFLIVGNIAPNETYYWQIKAMNRQGETYSATWSFRTGE